MPRSRGAPEFAYVAVGAAACDTGPRAPRRRLLGVAPTVVRRFVASRGGRMRAEEDSPAEPAEPAGGGLFDVAAALRTAESRGETVDQVLDRNLNELLQELRVAFTGVQILFAFLLSLAFTQRFQELDAFDVAVYTVALLSTAMATMMLMAPVSFHRIVFRRWQAIVGSSATAVVGLVTWYVLPLAMRRSGHGVAPAAHSRRRSPAM